MSNPTELLYTKEHEWARKSDDGKTITVGITSFAVEQLGDVTMVELPAVGDDITKGDVFGTVESVKAVSDLFAPVTGKITKINDELDGAPESVNDEPYGSGWMLEIEPAEPTWADDLMNADDYGKFVAEQD